MNEAQDKRRARRLRPEARAARYSELDEQQQHAFTRIIQLIAEAIGDLSTRDQAMDADCQASLPPWLARPRPSRTVLLHGDRGMGKTTVSLSIISASRRVTEGEYPEGLKDYIKLLSDRVVWLEPIDMSPLPGPTNLLAAVLARIDSAVRDRILSSTDGQASEPRRPGALGWSPDYEKALQQLRRLETSVALAWDGNLPERGAHLDPDTYASEVIRAELARLSLHPNLSDTLDEIARMVYRYPSGPVIDPLFVLTVDDVDLNPTRCLEVLKLLRLVPAPRLFTIFLGNQEMIELVLNLQCSNELASAYTGRHRDFLSVDLRDVSRKAGEVAANIMRKLLPPAQRIILRRMAVWEAFNFRPLVPDSMRLSYLHRMLEKCPIYLEAFGGPSPKAPRWHIKDLRDLLLYKLEIKDKVTRENVKDSHYTPKNILHAPPRRLADWWFQLQDLLEEIAKLLDTNPDQDKETQNKVHRLIVHAMGEVCRSAINEDTLLPTDLRSRYRDALRLSPADIWELVELVDSIPDIDRAYTLSNLDLPKEKPEEHPWKEIQPYVRTFINHGRGWFLRPGKEKVLSAPTVVNPLAPDYEFTSGVDVPRFNPDTSYALMLFHDLLSLGHEWELMRQSVQVNRPRERWAATVWGPSGTGAWISWPAPGLLSYWEYDVFVGHWNRVVDHCQTAEPALKTIEGTVHPVVYGWIDAGVAVWNGQDPLRHSLQALKGRTFAEQKKDWKRLAEQVAGLIGSESRGDIRYALLREWIWRLAYFLMPSVSGVTKDVTCIFAEQANVKKQWADGADAITRYHQEIFDFFRAKGMNRLAAKLKDRVEEYAPAMGLSLGPFDIGPRPDARP